MVSAPFGRPLSAQPEGGLPWGRGGVAFLVARSPVDVVRDGDVTVNGLADRSASGVGDYREGDRVFIRIPLAALRDQAPGIVLAWKDRTERVDPEGGGSRDLRRARLLVLPR